MPHRCQERNTPGQTIDHIVPGQAKGGQIRAIRCPACPETGRARYREFMPADAKDARDKPVVLSRIYTRTGDGGTTALGDGSRVAKGDPRLAAYADVDEANCAIGTALALGQLDPGIAALLTRVQNELLDVGADMCNPVVSV